MTFTDIMRAFHSARGNTMQKNSLNPAIIFGTLLLAACGGGSDNNPPADKPAVNNPPANDPQTNTVNDAFEASKYGSRRMKAYSQNGNDSDMLLRPSSIVVNGKPSRTHTVKRAKLLLNMISAACLPDLPA